MFNNMLWTSASVYPRVTLMSLKLMITTHSFYRTLSLCVVFPSKFFSSIQKVLGSGFRINPSMGFPLGWLVVTLQKSLLQHHRSQVTQLVYDCHKTIAFDYTDLCLRNDVIQYHSFSQEQASFNFMECNHREEDDLHSTDKLRVTKFRLNGPMIKHTTPPHALHIVPLKS